MKKSEHRVCRDWGHGEGVADSVCGESGGLGKLCRNGILLKF